MAKTVVQQDLRSQETSSRAKGNTKGKALAQDSAVSFRISQKNGQRHLSYIIFVWRGNESGPLLRRSFKYIQNKQKTVPTSVPHMPKKTSAQQLCRVSLQHPNKTQDE